MSSKSVEDREQEVKFYLSRLHALQSLLESAGARLVQARVHEFNLRFDNTSGDLARGGRILRLRQDIDARLTYKGPSDLETGTTVRQEIEFRVGDFASARRLLEALGFQISFVYEKYRAVYALESTAPGLGASGPAEGPAAVLVTLDQLPFGDFAEIEGPDRDSIQAASSRLALDWEARILHSYAAMFAQLKERLGLEFRDLVFANFQTLEISPADLGVTSADGRL